MRLEGDDVIMDDGRRYYANRGIIGLNQSLTIFEGYDGGFDYDMPEKHRREIAEYMIALWTRVRDGESEKSEWG